MAVKYYKQNGKYFYKVYVQARGEVDKSIRVQRRRTLIPSRKEALKIERKLYEAVIKEVAKLENRNLTWIEIVEKWEAAFHKGYLTGKISNDLLTFKDHLSRLSNYTTEWNHIPASSLTLGDGRKLINSIKESGGSEALIRRVKTSVNFVFKWGIEERLICGTSLSPVHGVNLAIKSEKPPQILSLNEIKHLLAEAQKVSHPWYPIWATALKTGMRSGELKALQWEDIDFEKLTINVSKSYCKRRRIIKGTKAGYWRTVPLSKDLEVVFRKLKSDKAILSSDFVLPRIYAWVNGQGGKILRSFLCEIGIDKEVVFHTLRSCFATHMLASGVDQATVMRIGGWKDIKTFQIYLRFAGVDVKGATEKLDILPTTLVT